MVTGAGAGLGRALARAFLEAGSCVVAVARNATSLESIPTEVQAHRFLAIAADVAEFDQVNSAVASALEKFGRIDVLFNNAAVYPKSGFLEETPEEFARAISINVCGIANCCKAVLPAMIRNDFGRVLNLGSFADIAPIPRSAAYSASKGAVHGLTKSIAADLSGVSSNVEIHEWIPGHLNTRMSDFTGIDPAVSAEWALRILPMMQSSMGSRIFENDHEWLPTKGLRARLLDLVRFWKRK
ncbi:MAG: SDR family oxidoreductase [Pseudomonadales bacterium]|nr:SDR family oxidoreductase [Pseudomonadales bacterium]